MSQYDVEQVPQKQPAACSLTGRVEDEWYVRLYTKDAKRGSILLSAAMFDEIARHLGYSKDTTKDLRNAVDELAPSIDGLVAELAYHRVYFSNVENLSQLAKQLEKRVGELSERLDRKSSRTSTAAAKPVESAA